VDGLLGELSIIGRYKKLFPLSLRLGVIEALPLNIEDDAAGFI
jgi:hypothetical protein